VRVVVIINPIAGSEGRDGGRRRAELAASLLDRRGVDYEILVTERAGHARELAAGAVGRGASVVCAWGGDGTVNEVACALFSGGVPLAIIPAGSGNGLARELGIPRTPAEALAVAIAGRSHRIDVGEVGGRLFVNLAGIGFDAAIAARFAVSARRGFMRYCTIAAVEMGRYTPRSYTLSIAGRDERQRAWMIVLANARQYGNGAVIAPGARPDDGRLDLVVVHDQPVWRVLMRAPRLFRGTLNERDGVSFRQIISATIAGDEPLGVHVDGEPVKAGLTLEASIHAAALAVKVPAAYSTKR
jgi:YegS/Rv2252/BmrU family lipid kinase